MLNIFREFVLIEKFLAAVVRAFSSYLLVLLSRLRYPSILYHLWGRGILDLRFGSGE